LCNALAMRDDNGTNGTEYDDAKVAISPIS
jgi:hypothetical protein